jgi:antitoxin (DNA-binding transcriptional repressor) of toxin-antitoxin stability system
MKEREVKSMVFRQTYGSLTEPVIVTVNGRPIGRWSPVSRAIDGRALEGNRPGEPESPEPAKARK